MTFDFFLLQNLKPLLGIFNPTLICKLAIPDPEFNSLGIIKARFESRYDCEKARNCSERPGLMLVSTLDFNRPVLWPIGLWLD